jgi:quinol monooxygenase YgiN
MKPFVITVEFRLRAGAMRAFLALIQENACRSLRDEPGCRQFDVLVPEDALDRVFLYEIYDQESAFAFHCQSAHFKAFDAASREMYEQKIVRRYTLALDTRAETAATANNDHTGGRHAQAVDPGST